MTRTARAGPLIVLTGASGSGKTTIAKAIEGLRPRAAEVHYFDRLGVPSPEAMVTGWGSGEAWQRARTLEWMRRLAEPADRRLPILLEGQMRFSFVEEGLQRAGIDDTRVILVDCEDRVRSRRLRGERQQSDLAGSTMMNWAEYLRREARAGGYDILDTSTLTLDRSVERVCAYLSN